MELKVSLEEIKIMKMAGVMAALQEIKTKIANLERKHGPFEKFKERVIQQEEEDMILWDALIEWEALIEMKKDLEKQLDVIKNAKSVEVIT